MTSAVSVVGSPSVPQLTAIDPGSQSATPTQETLVADARTGGQQGQFRDTTIHDWNNPLVGPWHYQRSATLSNESNGLSVQADIRLSHTDSGRGLNVQSAVSYQDSSGKPIANVRISEWAVLNGSKDTGRTWSVGGQATVGATSNGGGVTLGGGNTWINTTSGNTGGLNVGTRASATRSAAGVVPLEGNSGDFTYKFSVTVTYKDGTSNTVQVSDTTQSR